MFNGAIYYAYQKGFPLVIIGGYNDDDSCIYSTIYYLDRGDRLEYIFKEFNP